MRAFVTLVIFSVYLAIIAGSFKYPALWFVAAVLAWALIYAIEVKEWF